MSEIHLTIHPLTDLEILNLIQLFEFHIYLEEFHLGL